MGKEKVIDWKKLAKDILKILIGAIMGWLTNGGI